MNGKTVAALLTRALGLCLLPVLLFVLVSLAHGKTACELPAVSQVPTMYGYKASDTADQIGQRWTYLTAFFQYGDKELTRPLDRFPPGNLNKAQKEGNAWLKCIRKRIATLPKMYVQTFE